MKPLVYIFALAVILSCQTKKEKEPSAESVPAKNITFMTLDPGHFHAALVQKTAYPNVNDTIYVYAPEGPEVDDFLDKIAQYNTRMDAPTNWKPVLYIGADYLDKMISNKAGNVMVVAGKNAKKIDYILEAVRAGLHVYADKPLVIHPEGFKKLSEAFRIADEKGVFIYDIMTERFEATTMLQKAFSGIPSVFGSLIDGSPDKPAISKESVHHFYKQVSGKPLVRPAWFFDVNEEGEGIVDVTTHLVDLVQWELFPNEIIDTSDIKMIHAKRWATTVRKDEFTKVTGLPDFPEFLDKDSDGDHINVYSNGEMVYTIKGKHAKVSVIWNYEAPEGAGDTHYSVLRGTKSDLIIKQGEAENYKPTLYINFKENTESVSMALDEALNEVIATNFPGTSAVQISDTMWRINIPDAFHIGHEAHFAQVTQNYLQYLNEGALPVWEVPNMLSKYYTTVEAFKIAREQKQ
ncbi:putative oxidoreductase C-terminal domain-containing protein [Arenibacter sp. GZD96]|uniref:putative oxidoreductase C-terminal domain-containing protein n=1 Tax=Aurantibrevibacter litoralis TaxID=3106030 RepID=UPI002AFFFE0D|nr:putative oxidoreductase C-terminal domain-containing protein [Arenibacter sp. GZD-96]MEA1786967.1 putative oxidoreductase C-terminal domain-containing protein [Arenibacter sp. GZD-96]